MIVSSRTPEGTPNHCPVCGHAIRIEPSQFFGDAPCPACGTLLWFVEAGDAVTYYPAIDGHVVHERLIALLAAQLSVDEGVIRENPAYFLESLAADSLDLVELAMELEAELD